MHYIVVHHFRQDGQWWGLGFLEVGNVMEDQGAFRGSPEEMKTLLDWLLE